MPTPRRPAVIRPRALGAPRSELESRGIEGVRRRSRTGAVEPLVLEDDPDGQAQHEQEDQHSLVDRPCVHRRSVRRLEPTNSSEGDVIRFIERLGPDRPA
jgi:hypothetical protein